jgi:EmrB/QacA subfamily drug resistance transporter
MSEKIVVKSKMVLFTVMIGAFMSMFDSGVVNVGLPVMASQFHVDMGSVQWVTSVYLLVMSALLPILGTLADNFGRRRIYNLGFFVISIFTLFCGLSTSFPMIIVMRILQAIGGAMVMSNGMAIITENFPSSERGKNLGMVVTTIALGSIVGPPAGGMAIGLWGWRSIFYLTFVVSILGFVFSYYAIPHRKTVRSDRFHFDYLGSILLISAIVTFIYGFSNMNRLGWRNPLVYGAIAIFILSAIGFVWYETRYESPVMDLTLFQNRVFSASIIASLLSFITMFSPTVLIPFYYQKVLGFSTEKSGLYMMAFPLAMAVVSPFSGALSDKIGAVVLTSSGLFINSIALILLANTSLNTPVILILIYLGMMGLALGLFQSPNNSCIMGSVPKEKLGAANGITQLIKNLGMVIGIAFSVALFTAFLGNDTTHYGLRFMQSTRKVYYIAAALSFVGGLISSIRNEKQHQE